MELQEAGFIPGGNTVSGRVMEAERPVVPGARIGRDPDGRPAWFVPDPDAPGRHLKVGT